MNKLNVDLENCYGIKKLQTQFDFSQHKAYAIYAAQWCDEDLARTDLQGRS